MTTRQVSPPDVMAVTLADAKAQLRIDSDDTAFDSQLSIWIAGITEEAEHATGRAFVNRPMRVTLDAFPDAIRLSAPTFSVERLKFVDVDGQEQVLDPVDYFADTVTEPGYIVPASGKAWPATADRVNVVSVDYTAGYGSDATTVPSSAKLYILARLTEQWDPIVKEFKETVKSNFVGRLLDNLKVYG
ncbi:head-tail connector protein [Massilia rhizosphaerae]|uniref:head-tail connector protein n=1 Tax=Massilia rhizosphaerae TaxID=2784389 RepID=UPI0018DC7572|nr:phage head-tail connector protein [Massilia rhizosphaerae]